MNYNVNLVWNSPLICNTGIDPVFRRGTTYYLNSIYINQAQHPVEHWPTWLRFAEQGDLASHPEMDPRSVVQLDLDSHLSHLVQEGRFGLLTRHHPTIGHSPHA